MRSSPAESRSGQPSLEIHRRLDEIGSSDDFQRAAAGALPSIAADIDDLVEAVVADPDACLEASHGSYQHPNGFEKLLIASGSEAVKILIHTWTSDSVEQALSSEHVHNHRWPFATLVLRGSYRFEVFTLEGEEQTMFRYGYESAGDSEHYHLVPAGQAGGSLSIAFDLVSGAVASSSSSVLHRVVPIEFPITTLFIQGAPDQQQTTVLTDDPVEEVGELPVTRMDIDEWRRRVAARLDTFD
jgi:hypothetical protein